MEDASSAPVGMGSQSPRTPAKAFSDGHGHFRLHTEWPGSRLILAKCGVCVCACARESVCASVWSSQSIHLQALATTHPSERQVGPYLRRPGLKHRGQISGQFCTTGLLDSLQRES